MFKKNHPLTKSVKSTLFAVFAIGFLLCPITGVFAEIRTDKIIKLTNLIREEQGLEHLTANQYLTQAAYAKADAIFQEQTFAHSLGGRTFSAWIKDTGYEYSFVGENLAIDFATESGAINAWLASPTHRDNLLNPEFKETGVAIMAREFDGQTSTLIVQIFGAPKSQVAATSKNNPPAQGTARPLEELYPQDKYLPQPATMPLLAEQKTKEKPLSNPIIQTAPGTIGQNINQTGFILSSLALLLLALTSQYLYERYRRRPGLPMRIEKTERLPMPITPGSKQIYKDYGCGHIVKNI
jgi:hypothetical protein